MPIYEYRCDACSERHEALRKISDQALTRCPACGEDSLRKLISAAGFRLAGSGWYETDFKSSDRQRNLAGERKATDDGKSADKSTKADKTSMPATDSSSPSTASSTAEKSTAKKSDKPGANV